ncbi:MAG: hypothetical protein K0U63_03590 [Cyanobacteria bacterium]|nr:hypothetical protein [Cyanobacteriota bacterium]
MGCCGQKWSAGPNAPAQAAGAADRATGWAETAAATVADPDEYVAMLADIIQYDGLTGYTLRKIGANPNSQGSFDVVMGKRGEKLRLQGSNSRKAEMVIKNFSSEDLVKLDRFGDRTVRKGKLRLFQDGWHALISFKGSITLAPDPLVCSFTLQQA